MTEYECVRVLGEGLVGLTSAYGRQLFSIRHLRKRAVCASCGEPIEKGQQAWAEATSSAMNRMHLLHRSCAGIP